MGHFLFGMHLATFSSIGRRVFFRWCCSYESRSMCLHAKPHCVDPFRLQILAQLFQVGNRNAGRHRAPRAASSGAWICEFILSLIYFCCGSSVLLFNMVMVSICWHYFRFLFFSISFSRSLLMPTQVLQRKAEKPSASHRMFPLPSAGWCTVFRLSKAKRQCLQSVFRKQF